MVKVIELLHILLRRKMRLISKLHDYYDGVARNTVSDKTHTFVREQKEIEVPYVEIPCFNDFETSTKQYTIECQIVGFCGEIYPCVRIGVGSMKNGLVSSINTDVVYMYEWEEIKAFLPFEKMSQRWKFGRAYAMGSQPEAIKAWIESGRDKTNWYRKDVYEAKNDPRLKELFFDQRVAYYLIRKPEFTKQYIRPEDRSKQKAEIYPILKHLFFYKVFDAYTCFQRIEQFLTNEIVRPDEINIIIPDKMKVQAHGYDEWSFRKMKGD